MIELRLQQEDGQKISGKRQRKNSNDNHHQRLIILKKEKRPSGIGLRRLSLVFITVFMLSLALVSANNINDDTPRAIDDSLDENSVVLITGMAGFIGSELAMALHRIYDGQVKIIGVDSMDDGFGSTATRTANELGIFDFRRQRLFHVLQTLGLKCHFYRVDFRPNIPDYQDRGEVPVLDHIFASHPDITHVVHLADPYSGPPSMMDLLQHMNTEGEGGGGEDEDDDLQQQPNRNKLTRQAVPRKKDQIKAGMMETLLEQLRKAGKIHPQGRTPHFTYASSSHVYHHDVTQQQQRSSRNPAPFEEAKPITTPSSLHGASKLLDEVLAKTYYQTEQIYSVGLRFFDVYGPWSSPGTFLFDLAERAVQGGDFLTKAEATNEMILDLVTRDYVYIDDAVDAILAAMQFRPSFGNSDGNNNSKTPAPVVFNVGSGRAATFRTIVETIQRFLSTTVSSILPEPTTAKQAVSVSHASTTRAKELLGFESRVSLEEGILHLLAWHHDRAFPYGSNDDAVTSNKSPNNDVPLHQHPMASQGIGSCSPLDAECLKGAPVFPCASECFHRHSCTPSFYDAVLETTREWTANCETVLYTVSLDRDLTGIPSATAVVSTTSQSHVVSDDGGGGDQQQGGGGGGHCNLAFVLSTSPLVTQLQQRQGAISGEALKHGFWTLVPVDLQEDQPELYLELLPKLSPGRIFGSSKTKHIVYCDPDVIIDSIPNLLAQAVMQPLDQMHDKDATAADDEGNNGNSKTAKESRTGATAMLIGKGRQTQISNREGETHLQEAVQESAYRSVRINVIDQMSGDSFALPLDSSFIVHTLQSEDSRRFRCDVFGELIQWRVGADQSALSFVLELHDMWSSVIVKQGGREPWWVGEDVVTIPEVMTSPDILQSASHGRILLETEDANDNDNEEAADANTQRAAKLVKIEKEGEANDGRNVPSVPQGDTTFGHGEEDGPVDGAEVIAARNDEEKEDDSIVGDDEEQEDASIPSQPDVPPHARDVSAYDTWMGVLSSSVVQYFVRIVPSSEAGVFVLDDYDF